MTNTLTIKQALLNSQQYLTPYSDSAQLDAEILLCHTLQCERSHLYTWPEKPLSFAQDQQLQKNLIQRQQGYPIAYILGQKDFWSLTLTVNESVLIPRPETELLIETTLSLFDNSPKTLADLGTGSGAIACALAIERPNWQITAIDNSPAALAVAQQNAKRYQLQNITFEKSDWFTELAGQKFDAIISNPPYIAPNDPHLKQHGLPFEPIQALSSDNNGLADIAHLIEHAKKYLNPNGYLLLEHGHNQANAIKSLLTAEKYQQICLIKDLSGTDRVTIATTN